MDLRRKLPLLTTALIVVLCVSLATAAFIGLNRMLQQIGQKVDERLIERVAGNLTQGAQREREVVQGLIDSAQIQVASLATSPSALLALLADRDEDLKQQAVQPIASGTLELGRSVQAQIDQLSHSLGASLATARHLIEQGRNWTTIGEPVAWETTIRPVSRLRPCLRRWPSVTSPSRSATILARRCHRSMTRPG